MWVTAAASTEVRQLAAEQGQLLDGAILAVDHSNNRYRVQFDRVPGGPSGPIDFVPDTHVMVRESAAPPSAGRLAGGFQRAG